MHRDQKVIPEPHFKRKFIQFSLDGICSHSLRVWFGWGTPVLDRDQGVSTWSADIVDWRRGPPVRTVSRAPFR